MTAAAGVRVRFCPSPTGVPHVGLIRTALFNWAYARHTGGTFVFRLEDTDPERDSEESYLALLDALRWLGLNWDEGPEVGGPYGPYRQSQRSEIYRDVVAELLAAGEAYHAFSTPQEVEARHVAAGRNPKLGYDNFDRDLSDGQRSAYLAEGRKSVVRLRMPDEGLGWNDLVRGPTAFAAGTRCSAAAQALMRRSLTESLKAALPSLSLGAAAFASSRIAIRRPISTSAVK